MLTNENEWNKYLIDNPDDLGNLLLNTVDDVLDMIVTANYQFNCDAVIVGRQQLSPDFFDLKTGLAGEMLQKFVTYNMRIGIVGDFATINSRSFRDFVYESNKIGATVFADTVENAIKLLTNNGRRAIRILNRYLE